VHHAKIESFSSPVAGTLRESSASEAQSLVRRCAEPRPPGDLVKSAIIRAARRLQFPFNRTKDLWYGEAKRIDADEIDRLRQGAEEAEVANAIAAMEVIRNRALKSNSSASAQVLAALTAALSTLRLHGCGVTPRKWSFIPVSSSPASDLATSR
jgi:hypothetical protein